ncbi:MAG: MarR family winged helix-turn-helix transcriptional regulator [Chloroflexota bacterium]
MSSTRKNRKELIAALNLAMREVSGQGVLYSQAVAYRLDMNSTDLECLDHILSRGPVTAGALAATTGLTTGAITGVIDRLERAGLARREQDANDRRKVLVRALPAVHKRIAPLFEPMQRAAMAALSTYRDDELALLLDFLGRARAASLAAMVELRALSIPQPKPKLSGRSNARRSARR